MTKFTKILILFVLLFTLYFQFSYATDITETNENSSSTVSDTDHGVIGDNSSETLTEEEINSSFLGNSSVTSVSQLSSYSEANLGLNNILNIILIAIGVLIILFAIAILIRLKQQ